jgi:hypothetical protein
MTQLILKTDIDQTKLDVLLDLLKTWHIDAEVKPSKAKSTPKSNYEPFSETIGMWTDRDIDDKQLRAQAWGTNKRLKR